MPDDSAREEELGIVPGEITLITVFDSEPDELKGDIAFAKVVLGDDAAREDDPGGRRFQWVTGYENASGLGLRLERTRNQDSRLIARKGAATASDIPVLSDLMKKAVGHVTGKPSLTGTNVARLFLNGTYLDVDKFLKSSVEGSSLAQIVGGRSRDTQNATVLAQFTVGGKSGPGQVRIERIEGRIAPIGRVLGAGIEVNFNQATTSKSAVYGAVSVPRLQLQHAEAEKIFRRFVNASRRKSAK